MVRFRGIVRLQLFIMMSYASTVMYQSACVPVNEMQTFLLPPVQANMEAHDRSFHIFINKLNIGKIYQISFKMIEYYSECDNMNVLVTVNSTALAISRTLI